MWERNITQLKFEKQGGGGEPKIIFHFIKKVDLPKNSIKNHESEATALLTLSIAPLLYHLKSPVGKKTKHKRQPCTKNKGKSYHKQAAKNKLSEKHTNAECPL